MSDKPDVTNSVAPASGGTARPGDVPEAVRSRYLSERRLDGSIDFFADATVLVPSFRDAGRRLAATRSDPATIRDLLAVAQHRGWTAIEVRGAPGFRREVWAVGQSLGLDVRGYRPSERDRQAIEQRQTQGPHVQRADAPARDGPKLDLRSPRDRLRIAEAVVRDRIVEPADQTRLLAAARARAAELQRRRELDLGRSRRER
jgi:hypothetical protein